MALRSPKAIAQVTMILAIVVYFVMFISFGISSMIVDSSLRVDGCGKTTHLWKFSVLNSVLAVCELITYVTFPGGGEGARARALMISILHLALCVWGFLVWESLPQCITVISRHYKRIYSFYTVCIWHNLVLVIAYISHESFAGELIGCDLTLVPEVRKIPSGDTVDFAYPQSPPHDSHSALLQSPEPQPMVSAPAPSATITPSVTPSVDVPPLSSAANGAEMPVGHAVLKQESSLNPKYHRPAL
jgi:hypothetical protein